MTCSIIFLFHHPLSLLPAFSLLPSPQRVKKVTQNLHYNDPLRKFVDVIIKKFPEELHEDFNKGHDDYEDYQERSGEDALSKSSLEKLLKQSMKAVRLSKSTHV